MGKRVDLTRDMVRHARGAFSQGVASITPEEALFAAGGYRSILGVLKHTGGWAHVYRSYAFDSEPRHFAQTSWPRGLKDTVETTPEYFRELVAWNEAALKDWDAALAGLDDDALDQLHSLHWGAKLPLGEIVVLVAQHVSYHTGELNMLLSISRGEAWEYTEEVEENHISTYGHGVRGPWMSDEHARAFEEQLRLAHEARKAAP